GDVEALAVGHPLDDVEEDDVAEFFQADEVSERAADLTGAHQGYFGSCHVLWKSSGRAPHRGGCRGRTERLSRLMLQCKRMGRWRWAAEARRYAAIFPVRRGPPPRERGGMGKGLPTRHRKSMRPPQVL